MKIKICGLSRREDVAYVNQTRPDWCGFVIDCPKSRRNVSGEQAAALRAELAPGIVPVGVFVDRPARPSVPVPRTRGHRADRPAHHL